MCSFSRASLYGSTSPYSCVSSAASIGLQAELNATGDANLEADLREMGVFQSGKAGPQLVVQLGCGSGTHAAAAMTVLRGLSTQVGDTRQGRMHACMHACMRACVRVM